MASDSSLPIVTFGKYKGKPVTEMMADTKYVEWCKQQEFFKKHTTIYNIVVNQTIGSQQPSKTPEHNRIQNLFLNKENITAFIIYLYTHKYYCVIETLQESLKNIGVGSISVEFEGQFNWDIIIRVHDEIRYITHPCECTNKKCVKKTKDGIECDNHACVSSFIIEIKPLLGDDYPDVLRKMKLQKELSYDGSYSKLHKGRTVSGYTNPILLIKDYQSTTTTKEELTQIFRQSGIRVVFLHDIFPDIDIPSSSIAETTEPMTIQMTPSCASVASSSSPVSPSAPSSEERIEMLEKRIARLESLMMRAGITDDEKE